MEKEPKRYECLACGFISDRVKTRSFPGMKFAICFKCKGRVKEREQWVEWLTEQRRRHVEEIKNKGGGPLMGNYHVSPEGEIFKK